MKLLPTDEKFYDLFLQHAKITLNASCILLEGACSGNSSLAAAAATIQILEAEGDSVIHEIYVRLNQTFITPLDPEDIHSLSSNLDDVLDGIEDSAHRIVSYRIEPVPEMVIELCKIVHSCAQAIYNAIEALRTGKPLLEHCIEINRLEEVADRLVRDVISDLFRDEKDPITLMKCKEVYEFLEGTIDDCEDVANALQNVIVKNA